MSSVSWTVLLLNFDFLYTLKKRLRLRSAHKRTHNKKIWRRSGKSFIMNLTLTTVYEWKQSTSRDGISHASQ